MHLDYTAEQSALRDELRAYFASVSPGDEWHIHAGETRTPSDLELIRRMGTDGWLGHSLPTEFGGKGRPLLDQYILFDEAQRAGIAISQATVMTVAPALLRFGTEAQQQEHLPPIIRGERLFAIGYSEPEAGTDLANLRTAARRVDDGYLINGQKYFTSGAETADYIWLAARTGDAGSRHRGISIFLVPTTDAGFRHEPVSTLAGHKTNVTYYDDVLVPESARVGEENGGWLAITGQLTLERLTMVMPGPSDRLFEETCEWAHVTRLTDGSRPIDHERIRLLLAQVAARLEALRLLTWQFAWQSSVGTVNTAEAASVKVFGSEAAVEIYGLLLEVVGEQGYLLRGAPGAVLHGRLEEAYRAATIKTFGGGVNEVQRDMIAQAALGLPRSPRHAVPPSPRRPAEPAAAAARVSA